MRSVARRSEDGAGWVAECQRHSCFVNASSRRDAKSTDTVNFCDGCREEEGERLDLAPYRSSDFDARRKSEGDDGKDRCILCWRRVDRYKASWVHCVSGGHIALRVGADPGDPAADMGLWPIGSECRKRVPKGYFVDGPRPAPGTIYTFGDEPYCNCSDALGHTGRGGNIRRILPTLLECGDCGAQRSVPEPE